MGTVKTAKREDLTPVGFKPGVGMMYVDKTGEKFVERHRISVEDNAKLKDVFRDGEGHKIHMSKKERLRLKREYQKYKASEKVEGTDVKQTEEAE